MSTKNLSGWQKFKQWTSRHFGCASNYTVKHDDNDTYVRSKKQRPFEEENNKSQKNTSADKAGTTNGDAVDLSGTNPVYDPAGSDQPLERTLSCEPDDLPFIDASIINLPQAVKKQ